MEKNTPDTQIALLQQSMNTLTASMTRIELKIDKMDEQARGFATADQVEKRFDQVELNYVRIESFRALDDKVRGMMWGLGVLFAAVVGFIANTIFKIFGK